MFDFTDASTWFDAAMVLGILTAAYAAILWVALVVWTHRDIQARTDDSTSQLVAVLVVAVFFVPGLLLYVALRPSETLRDEYERSIESQALALEIAADRRCSRCARRVEPDYAVCPHCSMALKSRCEQCERAVDAGWVTCAYCGSAISRGRQASPAVATPPRPRRTAAPLSLSRRHT